MNDKSRIDWVDVFKGLGIFTIYLGHTGPAAGKLYSFVFTYHVALFFFVAGFFSGIKERETVWQYLKKQIFRLVIPYIGFVILSAIVYSLQSGESVKLMLLQGLAGIRNQLFAPSLWFIPCMFVMAVAYHIILRVVRKREFALLVAAGLFVLTQTVLPSNPLSTPSWIWNVDSAMYFMIFYALGAALFPYLKRFRFSMAKIWEKTGVLIFAVICVLVAGIVYFKGAGVIYAFFAGDFWLVNWLLQLVVPLLIIFSNAFLAIGLRHIGFLQSIGKATLILCGTELIIKIVLTNMAALLGLSINIPTPLAAVLYTMVCLVINQYTIVAGINRYLPILSGKQLIGVKKA